MDVQAVNKIVNITGKTDWDAFEKILEHYIEFKIWEYKDLKE